MFNDAVAAQGKYSHAEGNGTTSKGEAAHAEGAYSHAEGYAAHAEGEGCNAKGRAAHAEGQSGYAYGDYSHAEGNLTEAFGDCQHVQGKCNEIDSEGKYAHIVGNGSSGAERSNAHTLDWDGNAWFAGGIELTAPNGTRYRFTVSDDGTLTAAAVT